MLRHMLESSYHLTRAVTDCLQHRFYPIDVARLNRISRLLDTNQSPLRLCLNVYMNQDKPTVVAIAKEALHLFEMINLNIRVR